MNPPDIVRVPFLMDDNLCRTDGYGTSLIAFIQSVFSQVDSVGATAAWPQKTKKYYLGQGIIHSSKTSKDMCDFKKGKHLLKWPRP